MRAVRPRRLEKLDGSGAVKATILLAHLEWLRGRHGEDAPGRLVGLTGDAVGYVERLPLATDWIPFRCLVNIDRAIGRLVGGVEDVVYRCMGHNSAIVNLRGAYKAFLQDEPHRFFQQVAQVHPLFQNFGTATYQAMGPRAIRLTMSGYAMFSPVYCASALGYYDRAMSAMGAPGHTRVLESQCHCSGDDACVFEVSW